MQVLGLGATADGELEALLAVTRAGQTQLVAAWNVAGQASWPTSSGPTIPGGVNLASVILSRGGSLLVLLDSPSGSLMLERAVPDSGWSVLPPPPGGTATVVPSSDGSFSALVVDQAKLTDWQLAPGAPGWVKGQVLDVPIEYGSSS